MEKPQRYTLTNKLNTQIEKIRGLKQEDEQIGEKTTKTKEIEDGLEEREIMPLVYQQSSAGGKLETGYPA